MIKKLLFISVAFLTGLCWFWLTGLAVFVSVLKTPADTSNLRAPAAVVLTGGKARVSTGIALLREKRAEKLFISGVHRTTDVSSLKALPKKLNDNIVLGHVACNTYENASETKQWLEKNDIGRFLLVTSAYHLPRGMSEFKHAMPTADIVAYPVYSDNVKLTRWWMYKGTTKLILSEYTKYLIVHLLHILPQKYEILYKQSEGKCR